MAQGNARCAEVGNVTRGWSEGNRSGDDSPQQSAQLTLLYLGSPKAEDAQLKGEASMRGAQLSPMNRLQRASQAESYGVTLLGCAC